MRVAIVDSQVPFFHGGAELLAARLAQVMRAQGHDVDIVRIALNPASAADVRRAMDFALREDTARWIAAPDVVVPLRFPAYLVRHPDKRVWLLHQLRQYYEFYDQTRAAAADAPEMPALRDDIAAADREALGGAARLWAMSRRVAERAVQYNALAPAPLLWPPLPVEDCFYRGRQDAYVFAPSRLERHKRQWLLIEAMAHVKSDVKAVIGGGGGGWTEYRRRIEALGLGDRVLMTGPLEQDVMAAWYANALAVFFGPEDEDYGFVTLEAMLSGKPVITCRDSGGPLDFVADGVNGCVAEATPEAIAERIDALAGDRRRAAEMGTAGYDRYRTLGLTWEKTASVLLGTGENA